MIFLFIFLLSALFFLTVSSIFLVYSQVDQQFIFKKYGINFILLSLVSYCCGLAIILGNVLFEISMIYTSIITAVSSLICGIYVWIYHKEITIFLSNSVQEVNIAVPKRIEVTKMKLKKSD